MNRDIPDFNDRCRLVLLEGKPKKSIYDDSLLRLMRNRYGNNQVFRKEIEVQLEEWGYMDLKGTADALENEKGYPIENPANNPYYETNKVGEKAIYNQTFASEYWDKVFKTKVARVIILVGVAGGIMTICKEIYKLFS